MTHFDFWRSSVLGSGTERAHTFVQHKRFCPHPKPLKKVYLPHFLGKNAKIVTHINFLLGDCGVKKINCGPRGGTGGAKPSSGVQRFWGPSRASEFDPSFQKFGVSETPSQRPLGAPERLWGPRGRLFRGLGEGCPFSTERENKVGHSEASKRPRFPGCPLRGFEPSGSYPQATDKKRASPKKFMCLIFLGKNAKLSGPISRDIAILSLRYPISRDTFEGMLACPQMVRYPPLVLSFSAGTSVRYPILQRIAR